MSIDPIKWDYGQHRDCRVFISGIEVVCVEVTPLDHDRDVREYVSGEFWIHGLMSDGTDLHWRHTGPAADLPIPGSYIIVQARPYTSRQTIEHTTTGWVVE